MEVTDTWKERHTQTQMPTYLYQTSTNVPGGEDYRDTTDQWPARAQYVADINISIPSIYKLFGW